MANSSKMSWVAAAFLLVTCWVQLANAAKGTDCSYESPHDRFLLRAYVDPSPAAAAELFARLKSFFGKGSTAVAGVGDEAYMDTSHGLHVRKGKVRFFTSGAGTDKQLTDLA